MDSEAAEKEPEVLPVERVRILPQYIAAAAASISIMIAGTVLGWTSPTLPKLTAVNSTLQLTEEQGTWVGSLVALGAVVGPFPAGVCSDLMGRKRALLLGAVPYLASWCLLAVARSVVFIYVARILCGLANGWCMTVLPMYVGEIATPDSRGALGVLGQIMITLGFVYVYSIGPFVSYLWLCILCGIIPIVFFVSVLFIPESPYYEVSKNHNKAATKCLQVLRGQSADGVKEELNGIKFAVDESLRNSGSWKDVFTKRANRRAMFLMCSLMAIQQFSGINVVLFYSETIFKNAGDFLTPSVATIFVGLVMFGASFGAPYLIESLGRRLVLMISAVGMMVFLASLGACFFMEKLNVDTAKLSWVPLTSIIGYICLYSIGVGPVPWAMLGEMFAPNIRSKGAAFTAAYSWLLAFVMTKSFNTVVEAVGSYAAFWMFATCCALGAAFVYLLLPETKGKTLQEIQDVLNRK